MKCCCSIGVIFLISSNISPFYCFFSCFREMSFCTVLFVCFQSKCRATMWGSLHYKSSMLVTGHPQPYNSKLYLIASDSRPHYLLNSLLSVTCKGQQAAGLLKSLMKKVTYATFCLFAGCHWGIQWHNFCLWTNWKWEVFHHAGSVRACGPEGGHSTGLWAHLWEYSGRLDNCCQLWNNCVTQKSAWNQYVAIT